MPTPSLGMQDFFSTTLAQDLTNSATTIYVNSVPTASEGYLVLEKDNASKREIIYYNAKGANYVTAAGGSGVGRGMGGTTAQAHTAGSTVDMTMTSGYWNGLKDGTAISADAIVTAKIKDANVTMPKISNPYRFAAYRSANVNITSNSWTTINADTEEYDTSNMFSGGIFTAPIAGYYLISIQAQLTVGSGGMTAYGITAVHSGGGQPIYELHRSSAGLTSCNVNGSAIVYMAANQTITFQVYADGVGQASYYGGAARLTRVSGQLLSV